MMTCCGLYRSVEFGSFGGVTGRKNTYRITRQGKVWHNGEMVGRLRGDSRRIFKDATKRFLAAPPASFHYPANMNHYIRITLKDTAYYYQWGGPAAPQPAVDTFYQTLWDVVKPILNAKK